MPKCPHNYSRPNICSLCLRPRDIKILELRRSGATLKATGEAYGISPERVRQIVSKQIRIENRKYMQKALVKFQGYCDKKRRELFATKGKR